MNLLTCTDVTKKYRGLHGIADVSLSVPAGSFYGLVGPNGSGKTTLMNVIAGVTRADRGEVCVGGYVAQRQALSATRLIAYVPETAPLYASMTVRENLRFFRDLSEDGPGWAEQLQLLAKLSFPASRVDSRVATLSKGSRQKIAIAIGLSRRVKLFLFDEPTSGLDARAIDEFSGLLLELSHHGNAVMMATHDLDHVCAVASQIAVMRRGRIVLNEESRSVSAADLRRLYSVDEQGDEDDAFT